MVNNPPANAGDRDPIPGPGRFHMPPGNYTSGTTEPRWNLGSPNTLHALEPVLHNRRRHRQERAVPAH